MVTRNPKRMDNNAEHRKGLFKSLRQTRRHLTGSRRLMRHRAKSAKESKAAWKEKGMGRAEKQERAEDKEAADRKTAETMEAVREFNEARDKEGEPSVGHPDGSKP
jgi:hypothetical protein